MFYTTSSKLLCIIRIWHFDNDFLIWNFEQERNEKKSRWFWSCRIYLCTTDSKGLSQKETSMWPSVILLTPWRPYSSLLPQCVLRNNTPVRGSSKTLVKNNLDKFFLLKPPSYRPLGVFIHTCLVKAPKSAEVNSFFVS